MERNERAQLERRITEEQTLLNRYERELETERDPRTQLRLEREIERIKTLVLGYQTRLLGEPQPLPKTTRPSVLIANAPYGLSAELVGREAELGLLDGWLGQDEAHPLLTIIGLGGMGKSALTWAWLQGVLAQKQAPPLVVWWSFYETDGTLDKMMAAILTHFGEDPRSLGTLQAAVDRFVFYMQQERMLLLLDGAERLLRAYFEMGAAYQGDGGGRERGARQCVNPVAGRLLQWLAQPRLHRVQTVFTSRLFPQDLTGRGGGQLQGVKRVDLPGLSLEAAYVLFQQKGVATTRAEVQQVCESLGYHPLTLQVLAGHVAGAWTKPDDLLSAAGYDPTDDLLGKRTHVLHRAYQNLPAPAQQVLGWLAAFRGGVTWAVVAEVLGEAGGVATLAQTVRLLQDRGLVQRTVQAGETHLDLHPIVRRYAYDRLADPAGTHRQLVGYFEAVPKPQKVTALADLWPTMELYHHLTRARRYDEARVLFRDRLATPLYFQLGAYQTCIRLLRALFPEGEGSLPCLQDEGAQAWVLNDLAMGYHMVGNPAGAISLYEQTNGIYEKQNNKHNLAVGLTNLAMEQIMLGRLAPAGDNLRRAITFCQELENRYQEAIGHQQLGRLLALHGDYPAANVELDTALQQFTDENDIQGQGVIWATRAESALWQGVVEITHTTAHQAMHLTEETARIHYPHERDFVQAYWLLGWAAVANGDTVTAIRHLDTALKRCRAISLVEFEPAILLTQARLAWAQGQPRQALALAQEAQYIAERSGYRLYLADLHNLLAQLALAVGDQPAAQQHAQSAYNYAYCDGPPYVYASALAEAEGILGKMGVG